MGGEEQNYDLEAPGSRFDSRWRGVRMRQWMQGRMTAVFPAPPVLMMTSGLQLENGAPCFFFLRGELARVSRRRWWGELSGFRALSPSLWSHGEQTTQGWWEAPDPRKWGQVSCSCWQPSPGLLCPQPSKADFLENLPSPPNPTPNSIHNKLITSLAGIGPCLLAPCELTLK